MILAHEIPDGSRLYFGKSAKLKRTIEAKTCEILQNENFEEIVTPYFAYHAHQLRENESESAKLIQISSPDNTYLTLRADSSLDVVRLITKRLGKSVKQAKWFYAQPVFCFPSKEFYQIGAEWINSTDVAKMLEIMVSCFEAISIKPSIQLSNSKIPQFVNEHFNLDKNDLSPLNVSKLSSFNSQWLDELITLEQGEITNAPKEVEDAIRELNIISRAIKNNNIVLHPLYHSDVDFYDGLFFRAIVDNAVVAKGGIYKSENINCVGFALYIDNILGKIDE